MTAKSVPSENHLHACSPAKMCVRFLRDIGHRQHQVPWGHGIRSSFIRADCSKIRRGGDWHSLSGSDPQSHCVGLFDFSGVEVSLHPSCASAPLLLKKATAQIPDNFPPASN